MTEIKKSFKGLAAALSLATLSMFGAGCNQDNRLPGEKAFDAYVHQIESNPLLAFAAEIDDNDVSARSIAFNNIFQHTDFIIQTVQKNKRRSINQAVTDAFALLRQQKKRVDSAYDEEFLVNYAPEYHNLSRDEWIKFFRDSAKTARLIQTQGMDKRGVVPRPLEGAIKRYDLSSRQWREAETTSDSAEVGLNLYVRRVYSAEKYSRLVQRYESWGK